MRLRAFIYIALISLPALLLVGFGSAYVAFNVPKWEKSEELRIKREYRETAEAILEDPKKGEVAGSRLKDWRWTGRVRNHQWGVAETEEKAVVWVRDSPVKFRHVSVDLIDAVPYGLIFYWGGGLAAFVIIVLTVLADWSLLMFLRERDDFLAATAHDLTTPLVGMRYAIGRDADEARRLNERMIRLVTNIKEFLRLGGRRKPPEPAVFDLAAVCREAYSLFAEDYRDLFDGRDVEISADGDARVFADETMALQIVWNLFGNDLKYAAPFGGVSVRLLRRGGYVVAEFADEGQGMTRRQMRRAFDRYYRAKTALESGKGGFGIGLCTAREFARSMGGDLTVRPNSPKGCVFELSLPAAPSSVGPRPTSRGMAFGLDNAE